MPVVRATVLRPARRPARSQGSAVRAEAVALAGARNRALPIDPLLRRGARTCRPTARQVLFEELVEEVRETPRRQPGVRNPLDISPIERGLTVDADREQMLRVLINLARNAMQALESRAPNEPSRDQIRITGRREGAVAVRRTRRHRAGPFRKRRGCICSKPSRVRPAPAAPVSASPLRPNSCAPMAARSDWSTAPSVRHSASPFPIARSICRPGAADRPRA